MNPRNSNHFTAMNALIPAAAAAALLAGALPAQEPAAPAAPAEIPIPTQVRSLMTFENGEFEEIWIDKATPTQFRYRTTETAIDRSIKNLSEVASVYFYEPAAYKAARDLYQARRYAEARELFAKIAEGLKEIREMPNNHATLAAFYELECLRRMGDLDGLATALEAFREAGLTRPHHLEQVELYILWEAVRTKGWSRLDAMCVERREGALPGYQRAQVAYCHGLALEGLNQPIKALNAYAGAIVADYGAAHELVEQAALNSLRIYKNDPEVQLAIRLWGTEDEDPNAAGRFRLEEAAALAETYQQVLGGGKELPAEYVELLKYKAKASG
jgi:tetratricopeptide (TPR) repeat protein